MANKVRNNNVTVNAETKKVEAAAPIEEQEKKAPEATQEAAKPEVTQENPAPVEGQEQLPAEVSEVKKPILRFKTKEEKAAEKAARKAERLERSNALRADGHVIKGALVDIGGALVDAAKTAGKVTLGVVAVGGTVAGVAYLANRNKEESGENPDESEDNIIDDPVDNNENEVTSEESEANES